MGRAWIEETKGGGAMGIGRREQKEVDDREMKISSKV
jgi:hypothetical protein